MDTTNYVNPYKKSIHTFEISIIFSVVFVSVEREISIYITNKQELV